MEETMNIHTDYLWFNTTKRHEFINITDEVADVVGDSGISDGVALVSAMHITSAIYINDAESGLIHDIEQWLKEIAPMTRNYRHHMTGEDNGYAHLWNLTIGHQQLVPITDGKLDLGPWEQVYYAEFDGMRKKRVIVKVMGN